VQTKAVFFDIDGTLLSFSTHSVPESTVDALAALRASGVKTFVATGRMLAMIDVLDGIPFDGYITYNGAYCIDGNRDLIRANPIPQSDLDALAALLERETMPVAFMSDSAMTINLVDDKVIEAATLVGMLPPPLQNPLDAIRSDIYQLCIYADDQRMQTLMRDTLTHCQFTRWTHLFADVNLSGNDKQKGIDAILDCFNIDRATTMAFGDGGNDIPMLRHVALGVAMGNAHSDVKQAADYVTTSVDDDGIAQALRHFGLI
jgi:Cof subfamily protein (haloacid dehalogenase superfamily)